MGTSLITALGRQILDEQRKSTRPPSLLPSVYHLSVCPSVWYYLIVSTATIYSLAPGTPTWRHFVWAVPGVTLAGYFCRTNEGMKAEAGECL